MFAAAASFCPRKLTTKQHKPAPQMKQTNPRDTAIHKHFCCPLPRLPPSPLCGLPHFYTFLVFFCFVNHLFASSAWADSSVSSDGVGFNYCCVCVCACACVCVCFYVKVGVLYSENREVVSTVCKMVQTSQASSDTMDVVGRLFGEAGFMDEFFRQHQARALVYRGEEWGEGRRSRSRRKSDCCTHRVIILELYMHMITKMSACVFYRVF